VVSGRLLDSSTASLVLKQIANIWGYDVLLEEIDAASEQGLKSHVASPAAS